MCIRDSRGTADCEGKYIKQSGGRGQYGHVWIKFEPQEEGKGFEFVDATVGGSVPREYIKPTEEGLRDALANGIVAGYQVIDIKATLFDGSYHDVDSSEMAYKIAASMALKAAAKKCNPVILEPIMMVEVTAPNEYLGSVMGDVSSRRGAIVDQEDVYKRQVGGCETCTPVYEEPLLGYHSCLIEVLTCTHELGEGPCQVGSLTGAVAS